MTQMDSGTPGRVRPSANVYTALAIIATLALGVGAGYLAVANVQQTQFDQIGELEGQGNGSNPIFLIKRD